MKVLKFGGSSLGSPEIIKEVKNIVEGKPAGSIVVVSAFKGVTDQLIAIAQKARARDEDYQKEVEQVVSRHYDTLRAFISDDPRMDSVMKRIEALAGELQDLLRGIYMLRELTDKIMDHVMSFGERFSALVMSEIIEEGYYVDARDLIRTDRTYGKAEVDFESTYAIIPKKLNEQERYYILPGFIASDEDHETTTLGRGGSDYSAAIVASAVHAETLEIWTDVDGFMTADPSKVERAYAIEHLSYAEAMELSHFGAKVIYTPTIRPVYLENIPVVIKNTFNPGAKGTVISKKGERNPRHMIKGISSIPGIALLTIQGPGMVGVPGIASRLFGALARHEINIILITQASSEHSISFAIAPSETEKAQQAIQEEFYREMETRENIFLDIEQELSVIAIVGEEMKKTPGISATLFQSLGHNGVNIVGIAQGSSELNISVVVSRKSLKKALNVIHEGFFLSYYKELHLFMVGTGNVARELLAQIQRQQTELMNEHGLKINLTGLTNSRRMMLSQESIAPETAFEKLEAEGHQADPDTFIEHMADMNLRNSVFIDCTASKDVSERYKNVFNAYASVVTANKIACSSEYRLYKDLIDTAREKDVRFIYETNVGAGLPIINTIDDLIKSGDKILKLEAVLSGTLNYIFNVLSEDVTLSQAVKKAREIGYSEPDPRVDLSGIDVIRKLLILARESGYAIEQDDVEVKPFLPQSCFEGDLDTFWSEVEKQDQHFEERRQELEKEGKKWRFVARLENGHPSIELEEIDASHPAYNLEGSNNIVLITTERYQELPLVIKGYGAGAEVTAAGVFADVIRVANI